MAVIEPFRGILYSKDKVDITKTVTPPYDVISPSMQNRFYQNSPYNIIRLILGKGERGDTPRRNKYTRAKILLDRWFHNDILIRDRKPSLYIYTQQYLHKGRKRTRIGFIALMKIEDPKESGVLPHEYTLEKPKEDRLNLIKKTKANLSPIFSLFQDKENRVNKILKSIVKSKNPEFTVEGEGVIHKLWKISNKKVIDKLKACMRNKKIFIADGHHRYEVALAYRNRMRRRRKFFKVGMDYVMMYFSNLSERGSMTILSTHRVIRNVDTFNEKKIHLKLTRYFYITKIDNIESCIRRLEKNPKRGHVFGMYLGKGQFYLLTLKRRLKDLDVKVLHNFIIDKILGVKNPEKSIKYIRNEEDAAKLVDKGDYQVAFFLRPTHVTEMKNVAEKGEMMPQKSTYFYPKLLTGLVINKF